MRCSEGDSGTRRIRPTPDRRGKTRRQSSHVRSSLTTALGDASADGLADRGSTPRTSTIDMQYAPLPTEAQLERVRAGLGSESVVHAERLSGGLGCTMDVLVDGPTRLILRRYGPWYADRGVDAAQRETRALEILQNANIPAPAPIWIDDGGVFDEQAIITSFVDGKADLTPSNPFDWAEQMARTLARIHEIRVVDEDAALFVESGGEDIVRVTENPELVLEHPLGEELLRRRVYLGSLSLPVDTVFSHADFWPGNTLWRDSQLTGVVDWESPGIGPREMDVAYCSLDIRYLGMDKVADHFIKSYQEAAGASLADLPHWEAVALCRPMPDIAKWVPAWVAMGRNITEDKARTRYTEVLESFLQRSA